MKTQQQLEAMSDRGLEIILGNIENDNNGMKIYPAPDYCKRSEWIMPLVIKHKISITFLHVIKLWSVHGKPNEKSIEEYSDHSNPYRAATIVLILLLQGGR